MTTLKEWGLYYTKRKYLEIGNFKEAEFRPILLLKIIGSNAIVIPITSQKNKFNFSIPTEMSKRYQNINLKIGSIQSLNIDKKLNLSFLPVHNKNKALYINEPEIRDIIKQEVARKLLK